MEHAAEVFAFVNFTVIGLSHALRPHAWVDFFILLRGKGRTGVFANGLLSLTFGSLIVAFHPVWTGLPSLVTYVGALNVVKALVVFAFPDKGLRSMERVSHERAWEFVVAGLVFLALAASIGYSLWR